MLTPAFEDGTECSETSAYKLQAPGYYPKENIQQTEHGESLKSRILLTSTITHQRTCEGNDESDTAKHGERDK